MRKLVGPAVLAVLAACSSGGDDDGGMNPVPVASVTISPDPAEIATPTPGNLTLTATTKDASGNVLTGRSITWATTGGATVAPTTGATVTLTATAPGTVTASSEGRTSSAVQVTLRTVVTPTVDAITPATLLPGGTATITGTNFSATPANNVVTVGGVGVTVTAATATQLSITLPAAAAFPCTPSGNADVQVTVSGVSGSRQHPLQVATQRALTVGQRLLLATAADSRCNELSQTGGRYIAVVFNDDLTNVGTSIGAPAAAGFELRGALGIATVDPIPATPTLANNVGAYFDPFAPPSPMAIRSALGEMAAARRADADHLRLLEANTRVLRELAPQARHRTPSSVSPSVAAAPLPATISRAVDPTIGANNQIRIPNINAGNFCNQYTEVTAKTVYNGTKAIILADIANPDVGDMTSFYTAVGQEFDQSMFPILQTNFGNPLAMDASTDNNGKIVMVFSNAVNNLGGVAGFVVSCDFFARTVTISGLPNNSSNFGEFFYAIVPTSGATGFNAGTKESWLRTMRSTIVHEVKHITSFGERIARNAAVFELPALEEGTARHVEEIWARQAIYTAAWKGDLTYQSTLYCDVRPTFPECTGAPFAVFRHFQTLYDFMTTPETQTPFGRTQTGDFNFYASMWSLVRWAVDNYATSESAFLSGMTQSATLAGMPNISAQTGRGTDDTLADWLLSLWLDNYPSFTPPAGLKLSIPTWNFRDIFAGMNSDFCASQQAFCRAYPLQPRQVTFGSAYTSGTINLRGGSGAFFELSGTQTGKQLIDIHAPGGAAPASTLRLAIVRVQ